MGTKIRVWLDDDRTSQHHAESSVVDGMDTVTAPGTTDCGREGVVKLVHHENVDAGRLCEECIAVSGVRPALDGTSLGPV